MRIYLINLGRRQDRLQAMAGRAASLGLELNRVEAVDAGTADRDAVNRWFATGGPLGEIPAGDKACLLSHRAAWQMFVTGGEPHAVFLEDDVRLSGAAGAWLKSGGWIPEGVGVVKLEHYGPAGQRVLLADICEVDGRKVDGRDVDGDFRLGRMLSRHTGAAAYILSRDAAQLLLSERRFDVAVDHLLFNPNNSRLFARLKPWQLLPAIARQEAFVGEKSDIERTRAGLRAFGPAYIRRELVRFGYDLKLVPRQIAALLAGAKFVAVGTAD